ncbi:hypothetical protein ACH4CE_03610 [Streptomyces gelaticus]|uniref:hypothetical protein n=1 Tax=Streptomyces gelaticus TaxID=285446 RepID=UPI0037892962
MPRPPSRSIPCRANRFLTRPEARAATPRSGCGCAPCSSTGRAPRRDDGHLPLTIAPELAAGPGVLARAVHETT